MPRTHEDSDKSLPKSSSPGDDNDAPYLPIPTRYRGVYEDRSAPVKMVDVKPALSSVQKAWRRACVWWIAILERLKLHG
jgi:hypothetical protein